MVAVATASADLTTSIRLVASSAVVATATGDLLVGALAAPYSRRAVSRGRTMTRSRAAGGTLSR
jgi:hypothetical protein